MIVVILVPGVSALEEPGIVDGAPVELSIPVPLLKCATSPTMLLLMRSVEDVAVCDAWLGLMCEETGSLANISMRSSVDCGEVLPSLLPPGPDPPIETPIDVDVGVRLMSDEIGT